MKLGELNLDQLLNKYSVKKNSMAKDMATGNPDKTELPTRSGNQNTPVPNKAKKLLGSNDTGFKDPDLVNKV